MKFNVVFSVDDSEIIKLEWDVAVDEDGNMLIEDSNDMMVYEREGINDDVLDVLRKYMMVMINSYMEAVDDGGYSGNEEDEG